MITIIPCAGENSRFLNDCPKSILKVGDKTILDLILEKTLKANESIIITNSYNRHYFSKYSDQLFTVDQPTGCLSDVWACIDSLGIFDDVLLIVGDIIFDFDLEFISNCPGDVVIPVKMLYDTTLHNARPRPSTRYAFLLR